MPFLGVRLLLSVPIAPDEVFLGEDQGVPVFDEPGLTLGSSVSAGARVPLGGDDPQGVNGSILVAFVWTFVDDGRVQGVVAIDLQSGRIEAITAEVLDRTEITSEMKRVLFGTRNSHLWARGESRFQTDFVAITEDGAEWLVERGIQLVGVDYLSVAPYGDSIPTHTILLQAGVVVVEGLNLSNVMRGFYDLYCLPLRITGSDGAPARAILIQS